ncbi:hypothetical protein [Burkholderia orbicola]|uniref:hypothetical protein n=1 Tax=Burkholderia orbicola TaxID=2978683 RepID=UPI00264A59D8|nr:hypothetical protein [Burkholderia orbicola]MDN7533868.1 hypothetical protein [Burkholderia orbicola]
MSLFNRPTPKKLGEIDVEIALLAWSQFDDAIAIGTWMQQFPDMMPTIADLAQLRSDSELRGAIDRLVSGCISLAGNEAIQSAAAAGAGRISIDDVQAMPVMILLEAVLLIMEVNVDFFLKSLRTCMAIKDRMPLTGSPLLSSSSAPATTAVPSADTPSAS